MSVFHFIILALACYRLTVLIARDAGPFDVFKRARSRVKWLGCPFCVSIWIGALLQSIYIWTVHRDPPIVAACLAIALSAVAIMADRIFTSDYMAK